jgi:hypothetical protein
VCVPAHDSPNGTTFLTIVVYDKQKTTLVDDPSDLINTNRLSPGRKLSGPETIYSCDQVTWIIHSGGFLIVIVHNAMSMKPTGICEYYFQVSFFAKLRILVAGI